MAIGFVSGTSRVVVRSDGIAVARRRSAGAQTSQRKRAVVRMAEKIWQGEWVCIDCGYIYDQSNPEKFEELPPNWRCPQCRAPKRRFAKKAGDVVADSSGTSNSQIVIYSLLGLFATIIFGVWAAQYL
mmetsp:Transcript_1568/g.4712  ORF Transcript_1568/g.4712 Transcript_1568/m.4712 type:complete len:128 (+) Transcript_1568:91-474(+)